MKRFVVLILLLIVLIGCQKYDESDYTTSIYYIPHPDDETLSMGGSILEHLALNKEVVVVLLSKGRASKVIKSVNKKLIKADLPGITIEDFGEARVREFTKAMEAIGINEENYYVYDVEDGQFTPEEVAPIIMEFEEKYPGALHNTMSYRDSHKDHASTGKALRKLLKQGKVEYALYHIPVQKQKMQYKGSYKVPDGLTENYQNAVGMYGIWDPEDGFYHIGRSSVPTYFERAEEMMESRWHK